MSSIDRSNWTARRKVRHYDIPGHAHYLTFSCWRCQPFLSKERSRRWLLDAIGAARGRHPFDLWAYVIMPEHVHLLVLPRGSTTVSAVLRGTKQPVSQRAVRWVREHRPRFLERMKDQQPSGKVAQRFWQPGGGYDRNIWSLEELHEKIRYIHANPVRRGLVEDPGEWPWSSWRAWEEGTDEPIPIDRDGLPPLPG